MRPRLSRLLLAAGFGLTMGVLAMSIRVPANAAPNESHSAITAGFKQAACTHTSIGSLAFSPSGVLFFADEQGGAVYGVDVADKAGKAPKELKVADLGATLAARMGTTAAGIAIRDLAVSPHSGNAYVSVRKVDGANQDAANPANYALFRVDAAGKVEAVDLNQLRWGRVEVGGQPNYGARGGGGARRISDLAYAGGKVWAGVLSADAFRSNLVGVPVPFRAEGVERIATSIYHVSHRKQETASPVQTLTAYQDGDKTYLLAAYVCTPLVRFDLDSLQPGKEVTGVTVAELGSGNRPSDMIAYGPKKAQHVLLNNSSFGVLKVDGKIAKETAAVNQQTTADRGGRGATAIAGIEPVAAMKDARAYAALGDSVLVIKPAGDSLAMETLPLP